MVELLTSCWHFKRQHIIAGWWFDSVTEHSTCMHEALGSIPGTVNASLVLSGKKKKKENTPLRQHINSNKLVLLRKGKDNSKILISDFAS